MASGFIAGTDPVCITNNTLKWLKMRYDYDTITNINQIPLTECKLPPKLTIQLCCGKKAKAVLNVGSANSDLLKFNKSVFSYLRS